MAVIIDAGMQFCIRFFYIWCSKGRMYKRQIVDIVYIVIYIYIGGGCNGNSEDF